MEYRWKEQILVLSLRFLFDRGLLHPVYTVSEEQNKIAPIMINKAVYTTTTQDDFFNPSFEPVFDDTDWVQ